jgi:hypothetical protein
MARNERWLQDLAQHVDAIPYGDVIVTIERRKNRTTKIAPQTVETFTYDDNNLAFTEVVTILQNLASVNFSGNVRLSIEMKDGNLTKMGYYDEKYQLYN